MHFVCTMSFYFQVHVSVDLFYITVNVSRHTAAIYAYLVISNKKEKQSWKVATSYLCLHMFHAKIY